MLGSCACCYARDVEVKRCGGCRKRSYCSKTCQAVDWKEHGHKRFCGRAGELGFDFEIKDSPDKIGVGVFALRPFSRDEVIIAERAVLSRPLPSAFDRLPAASKAAVEELLPLGGTLRDKFSTNAISSEEDGSAGGLFVVLSRVNHACLGNADHHFLEKHGVKVLISSREIAVGEEITFDYKCSDDSEAIRRRGIRLREDFGFECRCSVCTDGEAGLDLENKLIRRAKLHAAIPLLCQQPSSIKMAVKKGEEVIKLYDELHFSSKFYSRTYYDMFQAAVATKTTLGRAKAFALQAAEYAEKFYGEDWPDVERFRGYAADPALHPNYLIFDRMRAWF